MTFWEFANANPDDAVAMVFFASLFSGAALTVGFVLLAMGDKKDDK